MVLLDLFARWRTEFDLTIAVAHVNYGLRGEASDADERLVRDVAARHGVAVEVAPWKKPARGNLQDEARRFRRRFFVEVARRMKASKVAIAQHRDDQAETVLLHLMRGAGLKGLGGMDWSARLEEGVDLIRPLLGVERASIEAYARARGLRYADDASNATDVYRRNELRHKLLPLMEEFNPHIGAHLASMADRVRDDEEALHEAAMRFCAEHVARAGDALELPRTAFVALPKAIARRVLMCAFERVAGSRADLSADHIARMEGIAFDGDERGAYRLPGGRLFERRYNRLRISP